MSYPIALTVYNRPQHTKRVLDALSTLEAHPLFVFCDGASGKADKETVSQVRWLIEAISWTEPTIVRQRNHIGLAGSIVNAVDTVLENYDAMILLEDDCEPGPFFLDYMCSCLDKYADNKSVISVGGYTMNLPESLWEHYPYDAYFFPRIETWGWGTWTRAWTLYERDAVAALVRTTTEKVDLTQAGADIPKMIEDKIKRGSDSWSMGWILAALLNRMMTVYPTHSHVRNIGMDGSGVHCGKTSKWDVELSQERTARLPDDVALDARIVEAVKACYR